MLLLIKYEDRLPPGKLDAIVELQHPKQGVNVVGVLVEGIFYLTAGPGEVYNEMGVVFRIGEELREGRLANAARSLNRNSRPYFLPHGSGISTGQTAPMAL